jgi:hypothetical protein
VISRIFYAFTSEAVTRSDSGDLTFNTSNYLVVFDAPINEWQSRFTVTDQYSAGRDKTKSPAAVQLYETLKQLGIRPARFAGGHGSSATYAEFEAIEK